MFRTLVSVLTKINSQLQQILLEVPIQEETHIRAD